MKTFPSQRHHVPVSRVNGKRVERANGSVQTSIGDGFLNYYTTLAGCDVCLEYWEKTPSVLQEFQYSFYSMADYKTISGSLRSKYGQPHYTEPLSGISTKALSAQEFAQKLNDGTLMDYAAWLIKYNDCYLLIEMNNVYVSYAHMYIAAVNYCPLSYEAAEAFLERESQKEESIENSLRNDL